jgi:hypothetical protein
VFVGTVWRWSDDTYFGQFLKEMEFKALSKALEEERALIATAIKIKFFTLHEVQFRHIVCCVLIGIEN